MSFSRVGDLAHELWTAKLTDRDAGVVLLLDEGLRTGGFGAGGTRWLSGRRWLHRPSSCRRRRCWPRRRRTASGCSWRVRAFAAFQEPAHEPPGGSQLGRGGRRPAGRGPRPRPLSRDAMVGARVGLARSGLRWWWSGCGSPSRLCGSRQSSAWQWGRQKQHPVDQLHDGSGKGRGGQRSTSPAWAATPAC